MPDIKEKGISLLSSTSGVDMKTATTKRTLYTVPTGKTAVITKVVVRAPSASLSGGTSYAFGGTATCNDWKTGQSLATVTGATLAMVISNDNAAITLMVAGTVFGMYITTGSTAAATATIDVMGYIF